MRPYSVLDGDGNTNQWISYGGAVREAQALTKSGQGKGKDRDGQLWGQMARLLFV